jgi:hypothetical protein
MNRKIKKWDTSTQEKKLSKHGRRYLKPLVFVLKKGDERPHRVSFEERYEIREGGVSRNSPLA